MEPESLEPLNLVIKKDSNTSVSGGCVEINDDNDGLEGKSEESQESNSKSLQNKMDILQDAFRSVETSFFGVDPKILTAFYMNSLTQIPNGLNQRDIADPFQMQQNFLHLLAMVEARQRMFQQYSLPASINNPTNLSQHLYDGPLTCNLNESTSTSSDSLLPFFIPKLKSQKMNTEIKQTSNRYLIANLFKAPKIN